MDLLQMRLKKSFLQQKKYIGVDENIIKNLNYFLFMGNFFFLLWEWKSICNFTRKTSHILNPLKYSEFLFNAISYFWMYKINTEHQSMK